MNEVYRIAAKVFVTEGEDAPLAAFIPIFHRWIQTHALGGLWIDVADYSHVPEGPGILLVGHEANLGLDETGGRRGLLVTRKQPLEGRLGERLERVARTALEAARLLEDDPEVPGGIRFGAGEIEIVLNDRLNAPNTEATLHAVRPAIEAFAARVFGEHEVVIDHEPDPRQRLTLRIRATAASEGIGALLERTAA